MDAIQFILYVKDQRASSLFYSNLLQLTPSLDVPGMTEFTLTETVKLGLMPEEGIAKIIANKLPHPHKGNGIPRCELYLKVKNPAAYIQRGLSLGGKEISKLQNRDWGDIAGYLSDLDGHIIAFAKKN